MKKKVKSLLFSFIFCVMFIVCGKVFRYLLIDDTASYTRITFHEMYSQDKIDVLFVGSSHCYRTFIPEIFDEAWGGVNTYNMGTSSQKLDGSYMVIKEVARYYDIKHIYLELYYNVAFASYKDRTEMTQVYIISDYLRPSLDKMQYLIQASSQDFYVNSFIPARRNWSKLFDIEYVKNLMSKKQSDNYKNYGYAYVTRKTEWYAGKGYVANNNSVEDWNYFSDKNWNNVDFAQVTEDWLNTLRDIITFCEKEEISLTLISAPMSNFMLSGIGNYDEYVDLVQTIISNTDVDYYDFNLCKEEYFPNTSVVFEDVDHVNHYGAELASHLLADFTNGKISIDELFYDSYEEKLCHLEPTVFGISYFDECNNKGETIRNCKIVSNNHERLEYEIILTPEGGNPYVVQNFSENNIFMIMPEEHGVCAITYRVVDCPNEKKKVEISY